MASDLLLLGIVALPFLGSCIAALLPSNARNAEAWLAGAVALGGLVLASLAYPGIADGGVVRSTVEWFTPRRSAAARTEPPRATARK